MYTRELVPFNLLNKSFSFLWKALFNIQRGGGAPPPLDIKDLNGKKIIIRIFKSLFLQNSFDERKAIIKIHSPWVRYVKADSTSETDKASLKLPQKILISFIHTRIKLSFKFQIRDKSEIAPSYIHNL